MNPRCTIDPFEPAVDVCGMCYGEFCESCLILMKRRKYPLCRECAVIAAGIRRTKPRRRGPKKSANRRREELRAAPAKPPAFRYFDEDIDLEELMAETESMIDTESSTDDVEDRPRTGFDEDADPGASTGETDPSDAVSAVDIEARVSPRSAPAPEQDTEEEPEPIEATAFGRPRPYIDRAVKVERPAAEPAAAAADARSVPDSLSAPDSLSTPDSLSPADSLSTPDSLSAPDSLSSADAPPSTAPGSLPVRRRPAAVAPTDEVDERGAWVPPALRGDTADEPAPRRRKTD